MKKQLNSILIVDDDRITVFGIRKMLDNTIAYKTLSTYGNGRLALDGIKKALRANKPMPEVIFLDINMPIMDGWQFLEEFIDLPIVNRIRINIVTSSIDPVDYENWGFYNQKTHHLITFNSKPIRTEKIANITKRA